MKKLSIAILIVFTFLICTFVKHIYNNSKCKNINYAVQEYITTGLFNNYKLSNVDNTKLSFSNGKIAVVTVEGLAYKSPYKKSTYNVFLEKSTKGVWKVKKVYPVQSNSNNTSTE